MIKNYLLISFRNLRKHFSYSVINIAGLGLGLATSLLLVLWIRHETSFDKFYPESDKIYRATLEMNFGGESNVMASTPNRLLAEIKGNYPEVEQGTIIYEQSAYYPFVVQYEDKLFQEAHFSFADSAFFRVFPFEFIHGNSDKALRDMNTVVITQSAARKYFGNENPQGKIIKVNGTTDYTVTGVIQDVPSNSSLQFDFMASFHSVGYGRDKPQWFPANFFTFIKVADQHQLKKIEDRINNTVKQELASELTGANDFVKFTFLPIADIHLKESGQITYVYIFTAIAILILLIACINYINLSTARAADRAKEVGIRKVVGALRQQLIAQFIGESIVITFFSFVVALFLVQLLLPVFNAAANQSFSTATLFQPSFLGYALLLLVGIALLSGVYPALAISAFKPVSILKGSFKFSGKGILLRRVLVVTQFMISVTLIVSTIVIYKQLTFIRNKNLGYNKENTIALPMDRKTKDVFEQIKTEIIKSGTSSLVARASESPTLIEAGYGVSVEGASASRDILAPAITVDKEFIPLFQMELLSGRNFTDADYFKAEADTTDASFSFIINETALKELYIDPDKAIGTRLSLSGRHGEIIGVVKDFHFASMKEKIKPLVLFGEPAQFQKIFIRLRAEDLPAALAKIKTIAANVTPHRPFEYEFVDQQFARLYAAEERVSTIFIGFASLAIIIACLGLLGLVSFTASQKTKEIGIRKVMGATAPGIVLLITKDFTRLILVAILIGLPLAYYLMSQWLSGFAYKTTIGVVPLISAALLCVVIAFGTAAYQAIKAALLDPAKTLRNE